MNRVFSYDKIKRLFSLTILALLLSFMINSCKKDESNDATNGKTTAVFNPNVSYGTMTDQDGNVYKTITIGTQTWMAENLRTTRYRDGTDIPNVTDFNSWYALSTGAYCTSNYTTKLDSIATFGRLYNWYAATDSRNIAPRGWHVPTDAEWKTLITYLGSDKVATQKLKERGTTHWIAPNTGATNESGFSAIPSGCLSLFDTFGGLGYCATYWSSNQGKNNSEGWNPAGWTLNLLNDCYLDCYSNLRGCSVRLVKD